MSDQDGRTAAAGGFLDPASAPARDLLASFLAQALAREPGAGWTIEPMSSLGGHHRCYLIRAAGRPLVLRCAPSEIPLWRRTHGLYDFAREYRILEHIAPLLPVPAPRPLAIDEPGRLFGRPSALLSWLPGRALPHFLGPEDAPLAEPYARLLATIAAIDPPPALRPLLPVWTLERIVDWLGERSRPHAGDPLRERALAWLDAQRPPARPLSLCHGDGNPSNILVDGGRIAGIVDWEFACLKDDPLDELMCVGWLYRDASGELARTFCRAFGRGVDELRWFWVRTWFRSAFTQDQPHPSEVAEARQALAERI